MDSLVVIDRVDQMLQAAGSDFNKILNIRDMTLGAQVIAQARNDFETAQRAKLAQLKSERAAGKWLIDNVNHLGNRFGAELPNATPLPDGVDKWESHRWQTMAKLPEDRFLEYVDECLAGGKELYASALYHLARNHAKKHDGEPESKADIHSRISRTIWHRRKDVDATGLMALEEALDAIAGADTFEEGLVTMAAIIFNWLEHLEMEVREDA